MMGKSLRAGNLKMTYEHGFLRYVTSGGIEIVRMVQHAVRDENWGTVPLVISNERILEGPNSFEINYTATFVQKDIDFIASCQIIGSSSSEVSFAFRGQAQTSFKKNRIGMLVLHPVSNCEGAPVQIIHSNGKRSKSKFPYQISPHQPFKNIKEMSWKMSQGQTAKLCFEGEIFETEDQRNWTDASYKTYGTPLDNPFPVVVKVGERIDQKVVLKLEGSEKCGAYENPNICEISEKGMVPLPKVGTEITNEPSKPLLDLLKSSGLDFVRVEMEIDRDVSTALQLLKRTKDFDIPVELAVFTEDPNFVDKLISIKDILSHVNTILLLPDKQKTTSNAVIQQIPNLKEQLDKVTVYAGTDAFFAELNREPVTLSAIDGVTYSINPQVHAFDDASLVETLEAQSHTVRSARKLFPDKLVRVSPVTFKMRWNPNSTQKVGALREPLKLVDTRQFSFFGACWWLISLKYLSESKINAITYFQWYGDNGWIKEKNDQQHTFLNAPMLRLLQEITSLGGQIRVSKSNNPLSIDTLILVSKNKHVCLTVNWTENVVETNFPNGFIPVKYCQSFDYDTQDFVWCAWNGNYGKSLGLPKSSLTVLEKKL